MKFKTILAVIAIAVFASCKSTYKATDTTVTAVTPSMVETNFLVQYPNATNVVWVYYDPMVITPMDWALVGYTPLDANARLAHFNQDNQNYYVLYDRGGYRVASAYVLTDFSVLPAVVKDVLLVRYPAYTITSLSRVTLNNRNNQMAYEVELKKLNYTGRILIDDNGNVLDQRNIVADHI